MESVTANGQKRRLKYESERDRIEIEASWTIVARANGEGSAHHRETKEQG
jgi:hypothetical protein